MLIIMAVVTEISQESSSSSPTYDYVYDVFLSFRGTDTRNNFTDHLHKALINATIDTVLDDAEIRTGEELRPELESKIKESRASIIVLSKNYASSTWCLDELVLILEQHRTSKHIVFPIFYHVNPTDVRKQQNSFAVAMADYKQKMEAEINAERKQEWGQKIKRWETALKEVADLKGKDANGQETIIIEEIVKEISGILDLHKRSEIPKLIGMESLVKDITSFLKDRSPQSTKVLTIWGMAGIGKTYLADFIFKLHSQDFERSSFLLDIERRCRQPNGLLDLQKKLLKDIRDGSWMDIHNTNAGTFKIEKLLHMKRTLLVLDGINEIEQLDVLIGTKSIHQGSKIIVTSKNESLTEKCMLFRTEDPPKHMKHMKHLLEGLDEKKSLQLLSWHAFGRDEPKEIDKSGLIKVVKYCKGHPLALKVLGSSLRNEDTTWEYILESLSKEFNPDIKKVLYLSYESLPYVLDKELFKYIACFFVGKDIKFTEEILKACGICKTSGIKILMNRGLLTVGSYNELMMHQLLQDMGRDIICQEAPNKPWKRSLLWDHEECLDVLLKNKGTTKIQGLVFEMKILQNETTYEPSDANKLKFGNRSFSLIGWVHILLTAIWWLFRCFLGTYSSFQSKKCSFETNALSKMRSLRLLQLNYVQFNGSYKNFPEGLRWLCMHGFRLSYIPSDLKLENIIALDMSNSNLRQLWKHPKLLRSLKFLNLSSCRELVSVGHFSGFPLLQRLILARCTNLVEVCESIGNYCGNLEVLDMSECTMLKKLPSSIGKLKKLRNLSIDGCSDLDEFPREIKDLESLEVLEANNIHIGSHVSSSAIVQILPRSLKINLISFPCSLVTLSIRNNNLSNQSFPKDFSSLAMLKKLKLDGNPIDSLPDCVRSLTTLDWLGLNNCCKLKTVWSAPSTIKFLSIYNCFSLKKITFHPDKSAPSEVFYYDANSLTEIQERFKLQVLAEIDEEILHSLGWFGFKYLKYYKVSMEDDDGYYHYTRKILPVQLLYEHGILSTYLTGQEVPKSFTHRSNGSSFTLKLSSKTTKIRGLNVCIVYTISSLAEVGPFRIEIRNLTKNCSWTYQPLIYVLPEDSEFEYGDEVQVWLNHWIFENNEFEDGDDISIHFSVKFDYGYDEDDLCYSDNGPDHARVREWGVSPVYDNGDTKEDHLAYYKSWKHIIGGDMSLAELYPGNYLLKQ